jgi:hypothetical protein
VVGETIMVAGGEIIINGRETLGSFEFFSAETRAWQKGPDLLFPMHGVPGAAFDEAFFLLGGSLRAGAIENEGQVQIYRGP